jgi:lipase
VRLQAYEWGERVAAPVVCVHGVTGHGRRFRKLAEERLAARHHVLAVDLRGHGRSGWEPPWDVETHVADLLETADAAGIGAASWIGHSFGGRLVLELAAREPSRVDRAVLLDPAAWIPPATSLEQAEGLRPDASFADSEEAKAAKLATGAYFSTPDEILDEEMRDHLERGEDGRLRARFCPSAVITAWSEMSTAPPAYPAAPTLVVLGARSWIEVDVPDRDGIDVVRVPGGHSVLWDDFEETADAIETFLSS